MLAGAHKPSPFLFNATLQSHLSHVTSELLESFYGALHVDMADFTT